MTPYEAVVDNHFRRAARCKVSAVRDVLEPSSFEDGYLFLGFPKMLQNTSKELLIIANNMDEYVQDILYWKMWSRNNPDALAKIIIDCQNTEPRTITSQFLNAGFPNVEIRDYPYQGTVDLAVSDRTSVHMKKYTPEQIDVHPFYPKLARIGAQKFAAYWKKSKPLVC